MKNYPDFCSPDLMISNHIDKTNTINELNLIIQSLSSNLFFERISLKAIISNKNYLTSDLENVFSSMNFQTFLTNELVKVTMPIFIFRIISTIFMNIIV